jgi:RNA polymerase sigma-B factor
VHELAKPQQDAVDLLSQDLGRVPTLAEVADFLDVPLTQILAAERARHARSMTSLDAPGPAAGEAPPCLATTDVGLAGVENLMALRRGLAQLDPEDVRLLTWYYVEEQTQTQIGQTLGVSQMQVSRLLARAVQRLRPYLSGAL